MVPWRRVVGIGTMLLWMGAPGAATAQEEVGGDRLEVFLDCQTSGCDFDFFRREITWVNWVRDREDADVQVLVTSTAAGGGTRFQLDFLGLGALEDEDATLTFLSSSTDTGDERRSALSQRLTLGLARYAAGTPMAGRLDVTFDAPAEERDPEPGATSPEDDPWNLWVFRVRLGTRFQGQSLISSINVNGGVSAGRTSEEWKFQLGADISYSEDRFETPDDTITSYSRSQGVDVLLVKSAGPHWGVGGRASFSSSLFQNYDARFTLQPTVEYNVFPYSESSRRSLTFQYRVGVQRNRYDELTIFNETEETLFDQSLTTELGLRQPWGSASLSVQASSFLHDFEQNRVSVFGNLQLRIVRGLQLTLFGTASRVRDQVNLALRDPSQDDVLLRRRLLETDFTYFSSVSLSYTFGSIFNNIVNPRFDGAGGGVIFF